MEEQILHYILDLFVEDFFYIDGRPCEFYQKGENVSVELPQLPSQLSKMIEFSKVLSKNTYHLRVDFYEVNSSVYVGELTFFDGGGFAEFVPDIYNLKIGDMIHLPTDKIN